MAGMLFLARLDGLTSRLNAFDSSLSAGWAWTARAVRLTRGNSINPSNVQTEVIFLHSTSLLVSMTRSFSHLLGWDDEIRVKL